jgi:DNA repair protein RecN (Recombination protein N)
MLTALHVRDYALFADVDLEFGEGFTAVTGETGAGKSLLVEALGLALGERAETAAIAPGRERASVEAVFSLDDDGRARAWLLERDLGGEDGTCVVRRVLTRDGRSRAFVNDRPVTVQSLDALGRLWVDFHGQHEHQILLAAEGPRAFLDTFAGADGLARQTADAWTRCEALTREREELAARLDREDTEAEWRRHVLQELEEFQPSAEDFLNLEGTIRRLQARERLAQALGEATALLAEDDLGARLSRARQSLQSVASLDPDIASVVDLLDQARIHADEAARALARRSGRAEPDASESALLVERHDRYHELARKHRTSPKDLVAVLAGLRSAEAGGDALRERLAALADEETAARRRYDELAERLGERRRAAAHELDERLPPLLADLGMGASRFAVVLTAVDPGPHGRERVEFTLAPHASVEPQPLRRIASGGELSRVALAVHVAAADRPGPSRTLIFDEIDSGIGGRVADRVARLLARLAQRHQVLCITHLGVLAARADRQIGVRKIETPNGLRTDVLVLSGDAREEEIARMIGGEGDAAARRHARALMGRARSGGD